MIMETIMLNLPTNRTVSGPKIIIEDQKLIIEYDYQKDDGSIVWTSIIFDQVLEFRYTQSICCSAEDIISPKEMKCLHKSNILQNIIEKWEESVGWHEWQLQQGGASRFKHYKLDFDDAVCMHIIAAKYTQQDELNNREKQG